MNIEKVNIDLIKENPDNPRFINEDQLHKLKKSLTEFPEMLELRPIVVDENMMVLGGNMRLKALKSLGKKDAFIIKKKLSKKKKNEFVIKDNVSFGNWKFPELESKFDQHLLNDWGLNITFHEELEIDDFQDPNEYKKPSSDQDEYSVFEVILEHETKKLLTKTLDQIKKENDYTKTEQAIKKLILEYEKRK